MIEWIVSLSVTERWFYGGVFTFITGLIIVIANQRLSHSLSRNRNRKNSFVSASSELISVFAPAIARIDSAIRHIGDIDPPEVNDFLRDNFEIHATAVKKFAPHVLSNRKRKAYEKAWKEYCDLEPYGDGITLFAGHCSPNGKHLEFIKQKIENILKFAKCK